MREAFLDQTDNDFLSALYVINHNFFPTTDKPAEREEPVLETQRVFNEEAPPAFFIKIKDRKIQMIIHVPEKSKKTSEILEKYHQKIL